MDNTDPNKSALRTPFISAANALANLYKTAAAAEKDARDAGSRAAYMQIMQWAARRSRKNEPLTSAEIISMCTAELSKIPPPPAPVASSRPEDEAPFSSSATRESRHRAQQSGAAQSQARDDVLASSIRKLAVNPRKRQRTAISETFIRACEDGYGNLFSIGSAPHGADRERPFGAPHDDPDNRDGRPPSARNQSDISVRKTRSGRTSFIEKQRRK